MALRTVDTVCHNIFFAGCLCLDVSYKVGVHGIARIVWQVCIALRCLMYGGKEQALAAPGERALSSSTGITIQCGSAWCAQASQVAAVTLRAVQITQRYLNSQLLRAGQSAWQFKCLCCICSIDELAVRVQSESA